MSTTLTQSGSEVQGLLNALQNAYNAVSTGVTFQGSNITFSGTNIKFNNLVDASISGNAATATTASSCTGNSATATKATQDGSGNTITSTYVKKAGDTMTGALSATSLTASAGLVISVNNGVTAKFGAQNSSYVHFTNGSSLPYYFDNNVIVNGNLYPYTNASKYLGTDSNRWNTLYISSNISFDPKTSGGWERGVSFSNNGTQYFKIGAYGTKSALSYGYMAPSYNDAYTYIRLYPGTSSNQSRLDITSTGVYLSDSSAHGGSSHWGTGTPGTASSSRKVPSVGSDGVIEIGRYIDFHGTSTDVTDYTCRIHSDASGGNCTCPTGSFVSASKAELKTNIEPLSEEQALNALKTTDIYSFEYKHTVNAGVTDVHYGGVIGEDYNCCEEIQTPGHDAIDPYSMAGILWKVVQSQQERIDDLENRIAKLEEMLNGRD